MIKLGILIMGISIPVGLWFAGNDGMDFGMIMFSRVAILGFVVFVTASMKRQVI